MHSILLDLKLVLISILDSKLEFRSDNLSVNSLKINYLQPLSLQAVVWNRSAEHGPESHVRVLNLLPCPHVSLQLDHSDQGDKTSPPEGPINIFKVNWLKKIKFTYRLLRHS